MVLIMTKNQSHLIHILKMLGMSLELIQLTVLSCQNESQTIEMLDYIITLYENKEEITERKLLDKIVEMHKEGQ